MPSDHVEVIAELCTLKTAAEDGVRILNPIDWRPYHQSQAERQKPLMMVAEAIIAQTANALEAIGNAGTDQDIDARQELREALSEAFYETFLPAWERQQEIAEEAAREWRAA